jgi:hypothetical protein
MILLYLRANDTSYIFFASLVKLNRQFAGRPRKSSFKPAQKLFNQYVIDSKRATLTASGSVKNKCKTLGLPETITVSRR